MSWSLVLLNVPPVTQHPLPAVPSAPTESVDEAEEQAVYEPIPGGDYNTNVDDIIVDLLY